MTWQIRGHNFDVALNEAIVALAAGNFDLAATQATLIIATKRAPKRSVLSAKLILIQVRSRQGLFSGVLDELDVLLKKASRSNPDLQAKVGNEIIRVCFRAGNLGMGAQRGEEFYRRYEKEWPDIEIVELLCQLGGCHFHRGDTSRAEEVISKALDLAANSKSSKAMTHSYWQMSMLALERGNLSLALQQANEAQLWAQKAGLKQVLPVLIGNAALIMLDLPNPEYSHIHALLESAYLDLLSQNNPGHAAYVSATLSEVALRQEDFERALYHAQKGLDELPAMISGPRASLLVQIAKVHARMGDFEQSKTELSNATHRMEGLEPSRELARQWGDIARVYVEVGLTDRGVYAYEKAIQMSGLLREEQDSFVG